VNVIFATIYSFFFQAEDGIRDFHVTGVQTCALPIWPIGPLGSDRGRADLWALASRCDGYGRSRSTAGRIACGRRGARAGTERRRAPLDVEPEQQDVSVRDHVVASLAAHQALFPGRLVGPRPHEVRERHGLGPDEPALEVGVDL